MVGGRQQFDRKERKQEVAQEFAFGYNSPGVLPGVHDHVVGIGATICFFGGGWGGVFH